MNTHKVCPFCIRNKIVEIIGEDEHSYFIASLGQINEGYILYTPKNHISCFGAMDSENIQRAAFDIEKIREAMITEYGLHSFIMFEHGIVGQTIEHAHIHFVPGIPEITQKVWADFPSCPASILNSVADLPERYAERKVPYLLWQDSSSDDINVLWNPPAQAQYFRTVCATAIGRAELSDWKRMDPELDKRRRNVTISKLSSYFAKKELITV